MQRSRMLLLNRLAEVSRELAERGISATPEELDYLTTQRMLALEESAPESIVAEQISGVEGLSKPISSRLLFWVVLKLIFSTLGLMPTTPS